MSRSKRYLELRKQVDAKKIYTPAEAIELVKKTATTTFPSTIEVHARLGIDIKLSYQQVRFTFTFPHATGKTKRIIAFVPADREKEAQDAGAEMVGNEELIAQLIQSGKIDFDVAVATPDMMPKMAKLAKILGPKGLMPNPKTETVGTNVKKMIEDLKKGKVSVKNDSTGNIHQSIGKSTSDTAQLTQNLEAFVGALRKAKPASTKGVFIKNLVLTSTMGPSVRIDSSVTEQK